MYMYIYIYAYRVYTYALTKIKISRREKCERFTLQKCVTPKKNTNNGRKDSRRKNPIPTTRQPKSLSIVDRSR